MTRISLTEAYDDRSVIAKLEKMSDQVDANTETAGNAAASAQASAEASEASRQAAETAKAGALDAQTKANAASAKAESAAAQVTDKVAKTGTTTPQVITGTGGLQVQGDLSVGGDLTVSESGSVHFDGSDMEVGGMAIEKSSTATVLSNEAGGIRFKGSVTVPTTATGVKTQDAVNGQRLQADLDAYAPMVRTSGSQNITGSKRFIGIGPISKSTDDSFTLSNVTPTQNVSMAWQQVTDVNDSNLYRGTIRHLTDNTREFDQALYSITSSGKSVITYLRQTITNSKVTLVYIVTVDGTEVGRSVLFEKVIE